MAITIEDVERFRAADPRSVILTRHRQVTRDDAATAASGEIVYTVAGQAVTVRQVPGGYTATHDCLRCKQGRPCFRALAAVDAEGTERFTLQCEATYHALKVEAAR
jgi:hypothetical protein